MMAYVFMADEGTAETWDPDAGDNVVIIQSPNSSFRPSSTTEGPTLAKGEDERSSFLQKLLGKNRRRVFTECEFAVRLREQEDPETFEGLSEADLEKGFGCKLGGTPHFVQSPEYPKGGPWKLLLQIDSCKVPFEINFGDAGVGYVYVSEDGKTGKFLWQCL